MNVEFIEHLNKIDTIDLINKIRIFRELNIKYMTEKEICEAIYSTITFENKLIYIPNLMIYPKGTKFYRVRNLDGTQIPNKNLMISSDFWNPPEKYVTNYGRINKPGESLLYTAPNSPYIAIKEMKLDPDTEKFYSLIVYEAKEDIKVNCIGAKYNYEILEIHNDKIILVNEIINNFLKDEFSRDVGKGTEYLYKISEIIAKDFFDLPPRLVQDAWAYSSVQSKDSYNVCFRPNIAKEKLELKGAMIVKNENPDEIKVKLIANGFSNEGNVMYHEIGSDVQKKIFPEISSNI